MKLVFCQYPNEVWDRASGTEIENALGFVRHANPPLVDRLISTELWLPDAVASAREKHPI
jgi:hypothetical protein